MFLFNPCSPCCEEGTPVSGDFCEYASIAGWQFRATITNDFGHPVMDHLRGKSFILSTTRLDPYAVRGNFVDKSGITFAGYLDCVPCTGCTTSENPSHGTYGVYPPLLTTAPSMFWLSPLMTTDVGIQDPVFFWNYIQRADGQGAWGTPTVSDDAGHLLFEEVTCEPCIKRDPPSSYITRFKILKESFPVLSLPTSPFGTDGTIPFPYGKLPSESYTPVPDDIDILVEYAPPIDIHGTLVHQGLYAAIKLPDSCLPHIFSICGWWVFTGITHACNLDYDESNHVWVGHMCFTRGFFAQFATVNTKHRYLILWAKVTLTPPPTPSDQWTIRFKFSLTPEGETLCSQDYTVSSTSQTTTDGCIYLSFNYFSFSFNRTTCYDFQVTYTPAGGAERYANFEQGFGTLNIPIYAEPYVTSRCRLYP